MQRGHAENQCGCDLYQEPGISLNVQLADQRGREVTYGSGFLRSSLEMAVEPSDC